MRENTDQNNSEFSGKDPQIEFKNLLEMVSYQVDSCHW